MVTLTYRGADKSLARPGRKQATATDDFGVHISHLLRVFGGLEVACWTLVPYFAVSNPAEALGFFGRKNPQHAFLRKGSKAVCRMSCFTACKKRKSNVEVATFGKISRPFLAQRSIFRC
jgi:hypothetical protein